MKKKTWDAIIAGEPPICIDITIPYIPEKMMSHRQFNSSGEKSSSTLKQVENVLENIIEGDWAITKIASVPKKCTIRRVILAEASDLEALHASFPKSLSHASSDMLAIIKSDFPHITDAYKMTSDKIVKK
jgi:hypothetical protein